MFDLPKKETRVQSLTGFLFGQQLFLLGVAMVSKIVWRRISLVQKNHKGVIFPPIHLPSSMLKVGPLLDSWAVGL